MSIDLGFDLNEIPGSDEMMSGAAEQPAKAPEGGKQGPAPIDLSSILGDAAQRTHDARAGFEIDLSDALGDLTRADVPSAPAAGGGTEELERVFEDFREEASRQGSSDTAGQQYRLALGYRDAGQVKEAIKAFKQAVRSPRHRFEAAAALARLHRDRGDLQDAIEWFERATQATAPSAAASHDLLYDLAQLLVKAGEGDRALAVFLELQSDAPNFRDVTVQIDRLSQKA
jgi:tetratricopeptide (TPR) repeat protein